MLQRLLLSFCWLLLPFVSIGQDDTQDRERSAPAPDTTYKHKIGLGLHWLILTRGVSAGFSSYPIIIQTSYKQNLGRIDFRSRIHLGYQAPAYDGAKLLGDSSQRLLFVNVGIEEKFFEIGQHFQMKAGGEIAYRAASPEILRSKEFRTLGLNLILINQFKVSKRSSILLEMGLFYGRYWYGKIFKKDRINSSGRWDMNDPRNLILAYNYSF